jgi:hypothetical protein
MKLSDFSELTRVMKRRGDLMRSRDIAFERGGIGVTIHGTYQDDEMIEAVKGSVVAEFDRRIAILNEEIVAFDIEIDE